MPPQDPQYTLRDSTGARVGTFYGTSSNAVALHHAASGKEATLDGAGLSMDAIATETKPWADVTAYGAAGDGIADDSAEIQAAINSAPVAYLPAGRYNIANPIDVGSTTIIGDGWNRTTINVSAHMQRAATITGAGGRVADLSIAGNDNAIEGLVLEGANSSAERVAVRNIGQWGTQTGTATGIATYSANNVTITNCLVDDVSAVNSGVGRGILVGGLGVGRATVSQCRVNNVTPPADGDGIVVQVNDGRTRILGNYVTGAAKSALKIQMGGGHTTASGNLLGWGDPTGPSILRVLDTSATISNNLLQQTDTASEAVRIGDTASDVAFSGNTIDITAPTGTTDGIRVRSGSENVSISGGTINLNNGGRHGAIVDSATNVSFGDVTIRGPGERGMTLEGTTGCTVTGCTVTQAGAHGINVANTCVGVAITGNSLSSTFEEILDPGAVATVGANATY